MPINVYTGLMGSGKSYECVSSVILPAICSGRRVVTNVDGIDNDACRAYCNEKFDIPIDHLGNIVHCKNEDVLLDNFLPHGTDIDTFCKPGDMVCIDEAWRFWGTNCKIPKEHAIFFREHRHYVDEKTKISCDLVLMVQDITDLHRTLKVVVEVSFRTTKIKSLGLNKVYRVEMWEGYRQTLKGRIAVENKKYDADIFPLYSSYLGGHGKELQVDKRQNILNNKKLWFLAVCVFCFGSIGLYGVLHFFNPTKNSTKSSNSISNATAGSDSHAITPNLDKPVTGFSDLWRISGTMRIDQDSFVILSNQSGRIRIEHPSNFQGTGLLMVGTVDGERVTAWSGELSNTKEVDGVKN